MPNFYKDFLSTVITTPQGKKVLGTLVLIFILSGRSAIYKTNDTKYILSCMPSVDKTTNKNTHKHVTLKDYVKILGLCQKKDYHTYPLIIMYMIVLVSRIVMTTRLMSIISRIVKHLTKKDWPHMFETMHNFALICFPSMIFTGLQHYLEKMVELKIQTSLTKALTDQYFDSNRFYKITDNNVDKIMTNDVDSFSHEFVNSFNCIAKPSVDIAYLSYLLSRSMGTSNLMKFYAYFIVTAGVLNIIKLPFSNFVKHKLTIDSDFKTNLSRTREYTESIAFLKGGETEKNISDTKIHDIEQYTKKIALYKIIPDMLDAYFVKYGGMMIGCMTIIPKVYSETFTGDSSDITEHYTLTTGLLTTLGKTIVELISVQKSLYNLEGVASRIKDLTKSLDSIKSDNTQKHGDTNIEIRNVDITVPSVLKLSVFDMSELDHTGKQNKTPEKEKLTCLIRDLNIIVEKDKSLVVIGSNGTGKSSLFRTLAGLWTKTNKGHIILPEKVKFIPQKSYFTIDNLYNSVCYPKYCANDSLDIHDRSMNAQKYITDHDKRSVDDLIKEVGLVDVLDRYGYTKKIDWTSKLSGGEKQRLAIVRALYDNPEYCVMDEATSAMSDDIEEKIYLLCMKRHITMISIVHKETLKKFHKYQLKLLGEGEWRHEIVDNSVNHFTDDCVNNIVNDHTFD